MASSRIVEIWRCTCVCARRLVQLTASRRNAQESLDGERATCEALRASIAELAEGALAAKVPNLALNLASCMR